jgi:hypothetical protein
VRADSVPWKGVDPMTLGVHRLPPLGLGLIQRKIAGLRVIIRAAGSWYRLHATTLTLEQLFCCDSTEKGTKREVGSTLLLYRIKCEVRGIHSRR